MVDTSLHRLEYGNAEPFAVRAIRHIPRPSIITILILLLAGAMHLWFWNDHEPWVLEHTFESAPSSLEGTMNPSKTQLVTGSGQAPPRGITAPFFVHDIGTGNIISTFGFPNEWAENLFFSADGSRILTIGGTVVTVVSGNSSTSTWPNNIVHLWDASNGKLVAQCHA